MFLIAGFGWGKRVYTDPRYFRTDARTGMALVAAAGPLSNLLMAYLASFPLRLGLVSTNVMTYFTMVFKLNLLLMIFNLLPIAPLDGYQVTIGLLPREWAISVARFERQGPLLLMLLIVAGSMFHFDLLGMIISPPFRLLVNLLLPT
jgi:Zn-dependent protease